MMQVLVNIPDDVYKNIKNGEDIEIHLGDYLVVKDEWASEIIRSGTPLPEDVTNGDVIKAMFPNSFFGDYVVMGENISFDIDWWNAPYKGVLE